MVFPPVPLGKGKMVDNIYQFDDVSGVLCIKATKKTREMPLGNCPKCFSGGITGHPCRYCEDSHYGTILVYSEPVHPIHFAECAGKPFDLPKTYKDLERLSKKGPFGSDDKSISSYTVTMPELIVKNKLKEGEYPAGMQGSVDIMQKNRWCRESIVVEDENSVHYIVKIVMFDDKSREHFIVQEVLD